MRPARSSSVTAPCWLLEGAARFTQSRSGLGEVEVLCHLRDGPVACTTETNGLCLGLRREVPPPSLLLLNGSLLAHCRAFWGVHETGGTTV